MSGNANVYSRLLSVGLQ